MRTARPPAPPPVRRQHRRLRRMALAFGVLAGLATAPAVAQTLRPPVPTMVQPAATARPEADAAPGTPAPTAASPRDPGAGADPPTFTSRSARVDDVARAPVTLRIPALGVRAPVSAAGVTGDGQLDVPASPDAVVWYRAGSVPGAAGSAVLAGHVDYGGQRGVFYDLGALERGDAVRVDLDDGSTRRFTVRRVERHAKSALPTGELFTRNGSPVLTLITCGGEFDRSTGHYLDNVVVRATPAG